MVASTLCVDLVFLAFTNRQASEMALGTGLVSVGNGVLFIPTEK